MNYVGIDVSKDWFDAAWSVEDRPAAQRFDYTDKGMRELLERAPADAVFVMEATGTYHARLALRLFEAKRKVSVVNPLVIKRYGQMKLSRVKTDRADALLIQRFAEQDNPPLWAPARQEVQELQQAHGWLNDMITEKTRLTNRQHAHEYHAKPSAFVKQQMADQLKQIEQRIKACEAHLEGLVKKSFPGAYRRLRTIPGIGKNTSIELIVVTDGFSRFDEVNSLCAYIGVSPTTLCSGSSVRGTGRIAKMGQARMRQLLYLCSWTARRCNPACKTLYERLKRAGKAPKQIGMAIAHKLVRQAFAIVKKDVDFSQSYA